MYQNTSRVSEEKTTHRNTENRQFCAHLLDSQSTLNIWNNKHRRWQTIQNNRKYHKCTAAEHCWAFGTSKKALYYVRAKKVQRERELQKAGRNVFFEKENQFCLCCFWDAWGLGWSFLGNILNLFRIVRFSSLKKKVFPGLNTFHSSIIIYHSHCTYFFRFFRFFWRYSWHSKSILFILVY